MRREFRGRQGQLDECVVRFWHGYVTGQFQACHPGDEEPFLCSPSFRTWRPPWQPRVRPDDLPEAVEAFAALRGELVRRGWRDAGEDDWDEHVFVRQDPEESRVPAANPASIAEQLLLRALDQLAGERGATAAELGRALYGDDAASVRNLPQRLGSRLRSLELRGKVARQERNGHNHWFPSSQDVGAGLNGNR
jgi:hypothetical protein